MFACFLSLGCFASWHSLKQSRNGPFGIPKAFTKAKQSSEFANISLSGPCYELKNIVTNTDKMHKNIEF